jgi:hypothetical protein
VNFHPDLQASFSRLFERFIKSKLMSQHFSFQNNKVERFIEEKKEAIDQFNGVGGTTESSKNP